MGVANDSSRYGDAQVSDVMVVPYQFVAVWQRPARLTAVPAAKFENR